MTFIHRNHSSKIFPLPKLRDILTLGKDADLGIFKLIALKKFSVRLGGQNLKASYLGREYDITYLMIRR